MSGQEKSKSNRRRTSERRAKAPARPRKQRRQEPVARERSHSSRPTVDEAVSRIAKADLSELFDFWGAGAETRPRSEKAQRERVVEWIGDPAVVESRVASLGRTLGAVFEHIVAADHGECNYTELSAAEELAGLSAYDVEASLTELRRKALVLEADDVRFAELGNRVFVVPAEVADGLKRARRVRGQGLFEVITLRGHLESMYSDPNRAAKSTPQHVRQMYKMYVKESGAVARIERLPDGIRDLVQKAILEFGGILPKGLFERMDTELPHWNGRRWKQILEQSLVGTVNMLELSSFGIRHKDETLVVFNEVALAWLRRVAVPGDPDRPHEELSLGIDLVTNLSRFLSFLVEHDVRFTVRGEIFKTTEKKIIQHLIPNPGRELSREEVLRFIFCFARHEGMIDRTGERTLAVVSRGSAWEERPLADKLAALCEYAQGEEGLGGESFHQIRLRQIFMRLLKRVEAGVWYDLMYLPFLARNTYLSSLEDMRVEEYFAERSQASQYQPMEDPQRMAWNLVRWVRQRLYLIGLIDLGYDDSGRPVAMRLTRSGARLLEITEGPFEDRTGVGNLVVTPDFEVVLFPTGDDAELIYALDRFCVRETHGEMLHFRITEETVRRALVQGVPLESMTRVLEVHSRTPVPQNVSFSIRDWAVRAGWMTLSADFVLRCEDAETLRVFEQDPGARNYIEAIVDENTVVLKNSFTPKRMVSLIRDLDFLVELERG